VHRVLEAFIEGALAGTVPAPGEPWPHEARARLLELADEHADEAERRGVTGFPLLWRRDRQRLRAEMQRFLEVDDRVRADSDASPVAAELSFGRAPDDPPAVRVDLPSGRHVHIRGSADRVDRATDGRLVVYDYKTSSDRAYADLSQADPTLAGTRLQLPVYALAAQAVHGPSDGPVSAQYWFVGSRGRFRTVGYSVTGEVLEAFRRTVDGLVQGIEAGLFPARPPASSWNTHLSCPFCDPDGLGVADVARRWEILRATPELEDLVTLLEPEGHGA
jgi:hypothetical protein